MDAFSTLQEQQTHLSAARILASTELLIWHANSRNESIPQTRLHFEKLLAGFNPNIPPPDWPDARHGSVDLEKLAARRKARPARSVADRAREALARVEAEAETGSLVVSKKEEPEDQGCGEEQTPKGGARNAGLGLGTSGGAWGERGGSEGKARDNAKGKAKAKAKAASEEGTPSMSRRKRVRSC